MSTTTRSRETRRPGRVPFFWLLGLVLLAASAAGAGWVIHSRAGDGPPRGGSDSPPAENRSERTVNCKGYVDVENGVTSLAPSQPYRVTEVLARENDSVKAGAVLLRVDDQLPREDLAKAEDAVTAAQLKLSLARKAQEEQRRKIVLQRLAIKDAQINLKTAQGALDFKKDANAERKDFKPFNKAQMIEAGGLVERLANAEQVEKEKLKALEEVDPTADEVALAETNLALARRDVARARHAVELCELKAPEDGKVVRVYANPGVQYGPQSHQPAFVFLANRPRIVRAEVGQEFAVRIREGQAATIQDESRTGDTFTGKVVRTAAIYTQRRSGVGDLFPLNDERTLEFIIQLHSDKAPLRVGQRVYVTLK